jgi:hypothetical protein
VSGSDWEATLSDLYRLAEQGQLEVKEQEVAEV